MPYLTDIYNIGYYPTGYEGAKHLVKGNWPKLQSLRISN